MANGPRVWNRRNRMSQVPHDAVYVGRPTMYGNPFVLKKERDRDKIIVKYAEWIMEDKQRWLRETMRRNLRGKDLVCWCSPQVCHADVILVIANSPNDDAAASQLWEDQ